jgi:predicted RNase H-like HicB family nuclease
MFGRADLAGTGSMRYTVLLAREEDGGYVASVPALPGCVSQGDTRAQALANIREAMELYIDDCRAAGDPVAMVRR